MSADSDSTAKYNINKDLQSRSDDTEDTILPLKCQEASNSHVQINSDEQEEECCSPRTVCTLLYQWTQTRQAEQSEDENVPLNIVDEVEKFIPGVQLCYKNVYGKGMSETREDWFRQLLLDWNIFLQRRKEEKGTQAILSLNIDSEAAIFIPWWEEKLGEQIDDLDIEWACRWLPRWNKYLQTREGEPVVSLLNVLLTGVGLLLYVADMISDVMNALTYACNGQYWQFVVTLGLVYEAVTLHTIWKWVLGRVHWSGPADKLRYFTLLLINWPDVKECWKLLNLEWTMYMLPRDNAHLLPELQGRRFNVARLKFIEGLCEACPQAILQLWLLMSSIEGDITWTVTLRIISTTFSLCTAGAAIVSGEKRDRLLKDKEIPTLELVILLIWGSPVTVSRLLSLGLLLTVHLYVGLVCIALHIIIPIINVFIPEEDARNRENIFITCLNSIWYCISPFRVAVPMFDRLILHVVHFAGNAAATITWIVSTSMACTHPALYVAVIVFNCTLYGAGVIGSLLHENLAQRGVF